MCYNGFYSKDQFYKYKRFKDGRCTHKNTGSLHLKKIIELKNTSIQILTDLDLQPNRNETLGIPRVTLQVQT